MSTTDTGSTINHVDIDGLRIGYRRAGDGPAVVLLHGALSDSRVWRQQIKHLRHEFTVIAWDAPGCGASTDPPTTFRLTEYADRLAGLVDQVDVGRPHVVGHSFGGALALEFVRRYPDMPATVALAGAYAGWAAPCGRASFGGALALELSADTPTCRPLWPSPAPMPAGPPPPEEVEGRLQLALRIADELPRPLTPESIPGLTSAATSAQQLSELAAIMSDARPAGARVMAQALAEADLRHGLADITVPVLILHGDADRRAPRPVAEALHRQIPGSILVVLPGIGHESYLEAPTAFNTELSRFLRNSS